MLSCLEDVMTQFIGDPKSPRDFGHWIDGRWQEGAGTRFEHLNPADDRCVGRYKDATVAEVDQAVAAAKAAMQSRIWRSFSGADRSGILMRTAAGILRRREELAYFEMAESGKPLRQARIEIERSAALWEYAATQARSVTGDSFSAVGDGLAAMTVREPIGVAAIVTPWNFPFLIIGQKLPFALAAGCSAVVKPSELTPATTLLLGEILSDAGLPAGVVNILAGHGATAGDHLISHPDVDIISFTGSTKVGRRAMQAGSEGIKKVSLELGGKNAHIVCADANLDQAHDAVLHGAFLNAGQSCNCGSRLLLDRSIADAFIQRLVADASRIPVGDPLDDATLVGPIINKAQFDKILAYIETGRREGATLRLGGRARPIGSGRYIEPTIFSGVTPDMAIAREEIFGPVLSILVFDGLDEAIKLANNSIYGLSAGIWTSDLAAAMQAAEELKAGTIWINTYLDGPAELPFGGYGQSGVGRENGLLGVEEFTEVKTVQIRSRGYQKRWVGKTLPDAPVAASPTLTG
jgi:betaine-aldehyde dehydrogenase